MCNLTEIWDWISVIQGACTTLFERDVFLKCSYCYYEHTEQKVNDSEENRQNIQ